MPHPSNVAYVYNACVQGSKMDLELIRQELVGRLKRTLRLA
jgi:hypothetical protein